MESLPLRRLVAGPAPGADRILFTSLWFKGHNNPRYAELLPRLGRLDRYLLTFSDERVLRGVQYRAYRWSSPVRNPLTLGLGGRRYRYLLTADNAQIRWFRGPVVADVDDPVFTPREAALLERPNVAAYVVTAERAARQFEALGVQTPWHVIPQGVSLSTLRPEGVEAARARRRDGEVVVGYMAAHLLSAGDRGGDNALHNVDHLLDLWDEVHVRAPRARLWLVGGASERVRARLSGRDDALVLGRLPRADALAHTSCFDVALYPRTRDQGVRAAKVAEYLGLGVPVVSYDYEVTENVREAGAGLLVDGHRAFVDAVVALVEDAPRRAGLAAAAARAGAALDWDVLARRFETEVLDPYLPRGAPR